MGLFHRVKNAVLPTLPADPDGVEWDADDPAGDETKYDGLAVRSITYKPELFDEVTEEQEVVEVGNNEVS